MYLLQFCPTRVVVRAVYYLRFIDAMQVLVLDRRRVCRTVGGREGEGERSWGAREEARRERETEKESERRGLRRGGVRQDA